jgi:hypothetical protein
VGGQDSPLVQLTGKAVPIQQQKTALGLDGQGNL